MTAIAPHLTAVGGPARLELALAARRTTAYVTLRDVARDEVDRLLDTPLARRDAYWSERYRAETRNLWRREEHLIEAIDAERAARNRLAEAQEGHLS